jgi:uncharacterized coiled-coil DUF342 family protein
MPSQSIKKLKNNLESKHKELLRIKSKAEKLAEQASESSSHSDKTRIKNTLYKLKSDVSAIEKELEDMKEEIYGSWAPAKIK